MDYGDKTVEWRIARVFVKWWVRRLIRKHITLRDSTEWRRSNMNIARMELSLARLRYWRRSFDCWGDWCYFGCQAFSYYGDEEYQMIRELDELGFSQRLKWNQGIGVGKLDCEE